MPRIHEKALVEPGARIGSNTRVWAFAQVQSNAVIGQYSNICFGSFIENGAIVGNRVTIKNGVSVWEGITLEDDVFVGPNCTFTNHMKPRAFIKKDKSQWLLKTLIKKGATLGANATILPGIVIGEYAFIAAGTVVRKDVPPHALIRGNPGKIVGYVCKCAQKLFLSLPTHGTRDLFCKDCK